MKIGEKMFKAEIGLDALIECIEPIPGVYELARLGITEDGWDVSLVNPENVAMVAVTLPRDAFEKFECALGDSKEKIQIGVNFDELLSMIRLWDRPSTIEIETNEKELVLRKEGWVYSMPLIELSALRRSPKDPEFKYPLRENVNAERYVTAIRALERVDEHIDAIVKDGVLSVEAERSDGTCLKISLLEDLDKDLNIRSLYSVSYLYEFLKSITIAKLGLFSLSLGTDCPLQIEYDLASRGSVTYLLAPRLKGTER